jgi:biopolymer transport protein ExbD
MITDVISKSKYRRKFLPYGSNNRNPLLASVPWINLVVILGFAIWVTIPVCLVPGMEVNLPEHKFASGSECSVSAIVSSISSGTNSRNIVFFNDKRFIVDNADQQKLLLKDMLEYNRVSPDQTLILFIDEDVRYGAVTEIMDIARSAGFPKVNMSTKTN